MWLRSKKGYSEKDFEYIYMALVYYKFCLEKYSIKDKSLDDLIKKISSEFYTH